MSQYLLLHRVKVQGANAVAGFTWGFPAITHFLGFTHKLSRKLKQHDTFDDIALTGCAVIAHHQQVHTYAYNQFVQSRNPAFQYGEQTKNKVGAPPIIEEGKMDMEISLLMEYKGTVGNREEALTQWLEQTLPIQRLAGGSIFAIGDIAFYRIDNQNQNNLRKLKRKLLPGFILQDRSRYLAEYFAELKKQNEDVELFDAWLDFIALKQKARPVNKLIHEHLRKQAESTPDDEQAQTLFDLWVEHISPENPYEQEKIPIEIRDYFSSLPDDKQHKKLLTQWRSYCQPDKQTYAVWEYIKKPRQGFLVPIMTGYKAISSVYKSEDVANTRDNETDVCFVEAVHSIGEWQGLHRLSNVHALEKSIWRYHYEENWYLCQQDRVRQNKILDKINETSIEEDPDDDFSQTK